MAILPREERWIDGLGECESYSLPMVGEGKVDEPGRAGVMGPREDAPDELEERDGERSRGFEE